MLWQSISGFVCWVALVGSVTGFTTGDETALRTALFTTAQYDVSVRPTQTTVVTLSIVPTSLNSIDIRAQTMSLSGWWVLSWTDPRLVWTPSSYANIAETHVFQDDVWTPTIVVFNSVNDLSAIDEDTIPVRIMYTGQLEWSPPSILTVSCTTDITHFPFDTQTCGVSLKTFGFTLDQMDLDADSDEIDMTYYSPNGEWVLLNTWAAKRSVANYSQVTFYFKFERKPEYYGLNLIMPVMIMAVMSLFIFVLPADSGEKMGYSLTVMLTFVVLMTLLASMMPSTADHTSYLEVYVALVLFLCTLSVVLSIFSLNLYFRDDAAEPVPPRVKAFVRLLMRLMCRPKANRTQHSLFVAAPSRSNLSPGSLKPPAGEKQDEVSPVEREGPAAFAVSEEAEVTWKRVSMVMDAFCLRAYIVVLVLLSIIVFSIIAS
ncbi:acetylcholine receptor subunit alpha-1-B-like [Babylonia areolata]|uniref:acetylcholine receptor subunit alpha-1-B-like n=1 Tax=Babylonia areolata TaxID=304850 RepID=UPI003FD51FD9